MPYTVTLEPFDFGGFIGEGSALGGTLTNVTPGFAVDTAAATASAPRTLAFTTATPPPPGTATLHVTNPGGDLFRSGLLTSLPASGVLTAYSVPLKYTTISGSQLAAMVSVSSKAIPLPVPAWAQVAVGALSLGAYIPLSGAITSVVPALNTPVGSVTFTVTGTFTFQTYYVFSDTISFTGTIVAALAPSGDATQTSRILSVASTAALTSVFTTGPSPTLAIIAGFLPALAPVVASAFQSYIESAVNSMIEGQVGPALATTGFVRSPSSVVSARAVAVTGSSTAPGSISLSLVLGDLFGPAVSRIPRNLRAEISPAPQAGGPRVYTVTVTDTASGDPVDQADVLLHNFTAQGAAQLMGPFPTQANGQATLNAALHPKITFRVDPITHERTRVFTHPTVTVSAAGYNTINLSILEDPGD